MSPAAAENKARRRASARERERAREKETARDRERAQARTFERAQHYQNPESSCLKMLAERKGFYQKSQMVLEKETWRFVDYAASGTCTKNR